MNDFNIIRVFLINQKSSKEILESLDNIQVKFNFIEEELMSKKLISKTDYQLLIELVPDIEERLKNKDAIITEIIKRATERENGFRPFHWLRG